jgi:hypothetical protein
MAPWLKITTLLFSNNNIHAGNLMVFLLLNLIEAIGLVLTFKPFLALPQQYKQ